MSSGETSSTCMATGLGAAFLLLFLRLLFGERLRLLTGAVRVTDVEERLLGKIVEVAVDQLLEGVDRLLHGHVDALQAGELLADKERLRQELLHLAGPLHDDLVLFGQFVEAEDGDDVLQLLERCSTSWTRRATV